MTTFFLFCVLFYVLCGLFLYTGQRNLIYVPDRALPDLAHTGARPIAVRTADGLTLRAWYIDPAPGRPVAVMFHGNAGNIRIRDFHAAPFVRYGYGFLFAEYRGYGGNPGVPGEQALYEDARAYLRWLRESEGKTARDIVIFGESLGTGVTTKMAEENPDLAAVILQTPYTSLPAVAQKFYPVYPARLLMRDRYDNLSRIGDMKMPVLILHGRRDMIVPYVHGVRLAMAGGENVRLVTFERGGHNNLHMMGAGEAIDEFLRTLPAGTHTGSAQP